MTSANLPQSVRDYLSKRGSIAGKAGRGACKRRGDSEYYKKIRAMQTIKQIKKRAEFDAENNRN
jgi:hypothetical protein